MALSLGRLFPLTLHHLISYSGATYKILYMSHNFSSPCRDLLWVYGLPNPCHAYSPVDWTHGDVCRATPSALTEHL